VIRSVVSQKLGYLMALRVTGQNEVIVNLPEDLPPNTILDLEFVYGGRLPAFVPEREALDLAQSENEFFNDTPEPSYIYTGRSGWYPQGPVSDYATANMVLRVPENYSSVGSGALDDGWPKIVRERTRAWKEYQYSATQPVRYLAWAISKFIHVDEATVKLPQPPEDTVRPAGVSYLQADVSVESSTLLKRRALELSLTAQDAMKFYGSIVDDMPYQTFSLAVVERSTPGGHSPPYFASLSQPPATRPIAWRNDPAVGLFVIVERRFVGLVPKSEPHGLERGASAMFRVTRVRPDGRFELSLRAKAHEEMADDAEHVLEIVRADRTVAVGDRSTPEEIRNRFGLSKKAFKRAVGHLLKDGVVTLDAAGLVRIKASRH